jgi:hypothetical protein
MKILIENHDTHEFLTATGGWTKKPLQGKAFPSTVAALHMGRQEAIGKFNVVCHIPQTNQLVNLQHGRGTGLPDAGQK